MGLDELTRHIFDRFDKRIVEACNGTPVPPSFVAGLIANESGRDKQGRINEGATRFEPHVFSALRAVRDGRSSRYGSIVRSDIADATDDALRALATSWGVTQIMGYHVIKALRCTLADLRDPDRHLFYTVKMLMLNGFPPNANEDQMDREMRQWNTGSETGKTYHATYVPQARKVRALYRELERGRTSRRVDQRVSSIDIALVPKDLGNPFEGLREDEIRFDLPGVPSVPVPPIASGEKPFTPEVFKAYIPQIDTAKRWMGRLTGLSFLSAVGGFVAGLPPWALVLIGVLLGILIVGTIAMFIKYHARVFNYVTEMNRLRAQPTTHDPELSSEI